MPSRVRADRFIPHKYEVFRMNGFFTKVCSRCGSFKKRDRYGVYHSVRPKLLGGFISGDCGEVMRYETVREILES